MKCLGGWGTLSNGTSFVRIFRYLYPEFITALIVYFLPYCIDSWFICQLNSTETYAVSGIVDNFLTIFLKAAEGLSVGVVLVAGYYNGLGKHKESGQTFSDAFWMGMVIAMAASLVLYFGVAGVCSFNNFSGTMLAQAVPYIQVKALSIFFLFMYSVLVGFLRSVKNTFVPMVVYIIGSCVFVSVDYVLIFGKLGFRPMCLLGSATASLVQQMTMCFVMLSYILLARAYKKYDIRLVQKKFSFERILGLLMLSVPVIIDKVSIAFAYAWLGSCMSCLGSQAGAAFSCIKLMERFAFLPAIGCAQTVTFLVSNDLGEGKFEDIKANITKVLLIATVMVGSILIIGSIWPTWFASFFDTRCEFRYLVGIIFPALSVLILIDLVQLILSAALRGAGDVRTVMYTRVSVIGIFFIPATYLIEYITFSSMVYKMLVTYALFLSGNGIMSLVYIYRLRQNEWKKAKEKVRHG